MENIIITLTNGEKNEFVKNTTYYEISKEFGLGKEILGAKVNNQFVPLNKKATTSEIVQFVDVTDVTGNKVYKSGLKFIFEVALKEVFPTLEITYQHSVPKGFLGEIIGDKMITQEDLKKIKVVMNKIIDEDIPIKKFTVKNKEAIDFYKKEMA